MFSKNRKIMKYKTMRHLAYSLVVAALALTGLCAHAATPRQMEQARVAAIKACLRNMNNGSDYLDNLNPSSLSELEGKLKAKEKENIGKLKSVRMPDESEYASWDKARFEKYWAETFVQATPVPTKTFCGSQIRKAIAGVQVTRHESETATAPSQAAGPAPASPAPAAAASAQEVPAPSQPASPVVTEDEPMTDPEMQAEEITPVPTEDVKPAPEQASRKKDSDTASIVVLCLLVVVVVALVGYALNVMKKNKARQEMPVRQARRSRKDYDDYDQDRFSAPVVQSDPEEESPFAAYSGFQEPEPVVSHDPRDLEIERLRSEIAMLQDKMKSRPAVAAGPAPRRAPRIIYLAQANADGVFTRADARYNMGNSIFKLVTTDGVSGSFSVIEDPTVFELALMMPSDFLVNACTGRNLQFSEGARSIVNEASGTALFEEGRWRVSRKAQIRYSR